VLDATGGFMKCDICDEDAVWLCSIVGEFCASCSLHEVALKETFKGWEVIEYDTELSWNAAKLAEDL